MNNNKKQPRKDPFLNRESQKYPDPIASRELIMQVLDELGKPVVQSTLEVELELNSPIQQEALQRRLKAMQRDGQIMRDRRNRYMLVSKTDLLRGRVEVHREGFGFLLSENGGTDVYLSPKQIRKVFHNDVVLVRIISVSKSGRCEGAIVEVLERNTHQLAGKFSIIRGIARVIPDNRHILQEILIPKDDVNNAQDGQLVVVEITKQPTTREYPEGKIIEILGEPMAPGMEIELAIRSYQIPYTWSNKLIAESDIIPDKVLAADRQGRVDLRHLPLVTIDGEHAKDFDDAVYCEPQARGGWLLLVAIADVTHYVSADSELDAEAFKRGNSVYFPGRVIPMLPEKLSTGICSLKPGVDRLALTCQAHISRTGKLLKYSFIPTVIRSYQRFTYPRVSDLLANKVTPTNQEEKLLTQLNNLHSLYQVLKKQRHQRGSIEFDTVEPRFLFDKKKKIKKIYPASRTVAHQIIEECMLLANMAAADLIGQHQLPVLYRNHDAPGKDKLVELRDFLGRHGISVNWTRKVKAKHFSEVVDKIKQRPDAHLIQTLLLRTMSQAVYHPTNIGHFGLGLSAYTHFTSPIRRYADLLLHRYINSYIKKSKFSSVAKKIITEQGEHCSMTERRADDAVRDVDAWLKCEYMQDKVGEIYPAKIVSVTHFGLFVELEKHFVEGLLHISELQDDYYNYDTDLWMLVGEGSGKIYKIGDKITVKLANVNLENRQIDFVLAD